MEKEEAALTVTEQQPVWPRCTFHLRRGNGSQAKFKEIHSVEIHMSRKYTSYKLQQCTHNLTNTVFTNMVHSCSQFGQSVHSTF